jgi:chromosome segregation and condensation protein ScpB
MSENKISEEELANLLALLGSLFNLLDKRKYTGDRSSDAELQMLADKVRFWLSTKANSYYKTYQE